MQRRKVIFDRHCVYPLLYLGWAYLEKLFCSLNQETDFAFWPFEYGVVQQIEVFVISDHFNLHLGSFYFGQVVQQFAVLTVFKFLKNQVPVNLV